MTVETVAKNLHAALEKDTGINLHRYPIAVSLQNGDLILSGEVENIAAKKIAVLAAAEIHGVQRIVDRLTVVPAEKMGDAEIRDHVCKILLGEPALEHCLIQGFIGDGAETVWQAVPEPGGRIVVGVKEGVVTLNGEVPSLAHKRLAGVLAWWVPGTRDVINGLEEVPAEQDSDDDLTDAVRLVLEKDPFVDAAQIRVNTKDWIVTLEGVVPTEAMRQLAERDAWYVLGVKEVVSLIEVRP